MLNHQIIEFLSSSSYYLLESPIDGCVLTIHSLFNSTEKYDSLPLLQFKQEITKIQSIDRYSVITSKYEVDKLEFISPLNLQILLQSIKPTKSNKKTRPSKEKKHTKSSTSLQHLEELLSPSTYEQNSDYSRLISLLKYESTGHKLSKLKTSLTTVKTPFLPQCNDDSHSTILSSSTTHRTNKFPKDLQNCLMTKIHFIPIIKPHTDINLGDCSYLDTCHKLDTCRYVHYIKHVPEAKYQQELKQCEQFNSEIPYWESLNPWNNNGSISNLSRDILPKQWINCDVKKFDFNILGKFAAVIADPAWNIHMNLPYGTCNDNDLLNLPLSNIQDEGVIFLWVTGRTIEIGKESLTKWGYKLMNEMIWIKTNQLNRTICTGRTGHWLNHSKEHLLCGVKGEPEWLDKMIDIDLIVSSTRETSRKPDELYGMVERLVGPHARKLEIFGRDHNTRPGWFTIGNQLKGINIEEVDVKERFKSSFVKLGN